MINEFYVLLEMMEEIENNDSEVCDFRPMVEELVIDMIEEILQKNNFEFERKIDGTYKIIKKEISDNVRKEVIKYFQDNIEKKGFDEKGELYVNAFGLCKLDPISIIKIVKDMGYNCFLNWDGKFVVSLKDYKNA